MNNSAKTAPIEFSDLVPPVDLSARERLALLIVDMQYHDASPDHGLTLAFERISPGSMDYYSNRLRTQTVPAIKELLEFFRSEEMQVIHLTLGSDYRDLRDCPPRFRTWTRNLERAAGVQDIWWSQNPNFQILEELRPLAGETVIQKTTNGAFNGSALDSTLRRMGITSLITTGVITSACIDVTARDAADRGYDCVVVEDATADYDATIHEATLRSFALNFGRVARSVKGLISKIKARELV